MQKAKSEDSFLTAATATEREGSQQLSRQLSPIHSDRGEEELRQDEDGGGLHRLVVSAYLKRPLLSISLSYPVIFALGFGCSLSYGYLRPERLPDPLRERAQHFSTSFFKAVDEMLSSDTMESLVNTTSKMKEVLDLQALSVSGRLSHATMGLKGILPNRSAFGVKDLFSTWQVPAISQVLGQSERIGVRMARQGISAKSPVVMIPGIITTGLEVWDGEECIKSYFRQRIWGTTTMFQSLMRDPDCWVRHLSLNATTGLDPLQRPHFNRTIRVRPAQGFESADFFLGGYWLWGLMIEALADIGYDQNSMHMAAYDWRLAFSDMELRDRYFTRLRQQVETLVSMNGHKAIVVAHSMGGNLWHYFMQWVTHRVHANWVHDHISSIALVSSPLLGLPKAYFSLLTGDNRDFANMGTFSAVVDHFFGSRTRRALWRSCSSLSMIAPIGGEPIWGEAVTGMPLVHLDGRNLTVEEAYDLLAKKGAVPSDLQRIEPWLVEGARLSRPALADATEVDREPPEHHWANALAVVLPFAPKLRMYALYGVGVSTEYTGALDATGNDVETPKYSIDKDAFSPNAGFVLGDGDYSCPVVSLGFMCRKGWQDEKRNPARIPCTVKEYKDKKSTLLKGGTIRGGSASGDHVDILGNDELLADVLNLASGRSVDGRIVSDLDAMAQRWNDV